MTTSLQPAYALVPGANLEAYVHTVNSIPLLTVEQERDLAERLYYEQDLEAARQMVMAHLRFVVHIARSYAGYGLAQADLIQEGERVSLADKGELFPADLSTGQQQRVGIARAIVHQPALLLADEPTGNLDPRLAAEIMGVFEDINRLGTTVLIASHDLALIARMRHRMLTLQRGRLIGDGEAGQ